jgi:hypothetical protein
MEKINHKETEELVTKLSKVLCEDPSNEAFNPGSDAYYEHAKMVLEPNEYGVLVNEVTLDKFRNMLEDDREVFINFLNGNISPKWGLFAKLITQYGY